MTPERTGKRIEDEVLGHMPERLRRAAVVALRELGPIINDLSEIRVREGMPLTFISHGGEAPAVAEPYVVCRDDITRMFNMISANSVHAFEEELRNGFVTVRGGHRIGMAGKAILENGHVRTLRYIRSLNIRIARDCPRSEERRVG